MNYTDKQGNAWALQATSTGIVKAALVKAAYGTPAGKVVVAASGDNVRDAIEEYAAAFDGKRAPDPVIYAEVRDTAATSTTTATAGGWWLVVAIVAVAYYADKAGKRWLR